MNAETILRRAMKLRTQCHAAMAEAWHDQETYGDPAEAVVTINGNDKNAVDVLYILSAIGVP